MHTGGKVAYWIKLDHTVSVLMTISSQVIFKARFNKLCTWRHNMARAPSRCNVAVLSNAEYVPTLTAAAALRIKVALSKAAW